MSPQTERTGNKTSRNLNRRRTDAGRGPFPQIVPSSTPRLAPTTSTHHPNYEEDCGPTQGGTSSTRTCPTTSRAQGHQRQPSLYTAHTEDGVPQPQQLKDPSCDECTFVQRKARDDAKASHTNIKGPTMNWNRRSYATDHTRLQRTTWSPME